MSNNVEYRTVLHVGCGTRSPHKLHPYFRMEGWREVRVDIDLRVRPDIVADISDLSAFRSASVDAVWSSHNMEHLHDHEVPRALSEFRRVLKSSGILLITTPDIQIAARMIAEGKLEETAYVAPAGPITPLDIVFGHRKSIENGSPYMAHKTGFTQRRMSRLLKEAGFERHIVLRGRNIDLWAVAIMADAPEELLTAPFRKTVTKP